MTHRANSIETILLEIEKKRPRTQSPVSPQLLEAIDLTNKEIESAFKVDAAFSAALKKTDDGKALASSEQRAAK